MTLTETESLTLLLSGLQAEGLPHQGRASDQPEPGGGDGLQHHGGDPGQGHAGLHQAQADGAN